MKTQDRIIELAREAGPYLDGENTQQHLYVLPKSELTRFAAFVRAQVLEEVADMVSACDPRATPKGIAAAIRALKGQP